MLNCFEIKADNRRTPNNNVASVYHCLMYKATVQTMPIMYSTRVLQLRRDLTLHASHEE